MTTSAAMVNGQVALALHDAGLVVIANCWPMQDGSCGFKGHYKNGVCNHEVEDTGKAPLYKGWNTAKPSRDAHRKTWGKYPLANVGLNIALSNLLVGDPDDASAVDECHRRGVPGAVIRQSRMPAFLFRAPSDCPKYPATNKGQSGELDVFTSGQVVVHGRHRLGFEVALDVLDPSAIDLYPAPFWLEEIVTKAASESTERKAHVDSGDEPPVRLGDIQLAAWRGEVVKSHGEIVKNGPGITVDRSATLFLIGGDLAKAGASWQTIVDALADRDTALGYIKYAERRDGGQEEYQRIADKVLESPLATPPSINGHVPPELTRPGEKPETKDQETQARAMVRFAFEAGVELFHTSDQLTFATIPIDGHRETWATPSRSFRLWLQRLFYRAKGGIANAESTAAALNTLAGAALFDGPMDTVFLRTGERDGSIYVDLCDAKWRAAEIDSAGWRVVENHQIRFLRSPAMAALPEPIAGGNLNELRPFVNVDDHDWPLFKAWLRQALRPTGPYPPLDLNGEQGSAKSTTTRVARSLVDPSDVPIRTAPREARDLAIAAANSYVLAYDNLSHLSDWLSDALCRMSTGGGFGTRTLYTDDEEKLFKATRPVIVNGIGDIIERPDLLDRAIPITCPQIPEDQRLEETVFWARFNALRPRLFGALLDDLSRALRNLPATRLTCLPRMADFARWATAAESDSERGTFLTSYTRNRDDANVLALEGSALVEALYQFMALQRTWTGTALELWKGLVALVAPEPTASDGKVEPLKSRLPRDWPGNARALSASLRRLAPNLRKAGVDIKLDQRGPQPKRSRTIVVSRVDAKGDANATEGDAKPSQVDAKNAEGTQNDHVDARNANIPLFAEPATPTEGLKAQISAANAPANGRSDKTGDFASFAYPVSTADIVEPLAVGDWVNAVTAAGDIVTDTPRRVVSLTDYKGVRWVHVEGSQTGWPIDQIELVERAASYGVAP